MSRAGGRDAVAPTTLDRDALDALAEMTGGDAEFLGELIDTFVEDGHALLAAMVAAAGASDAASLRRAAHTLKSNARSFGAATLGTICEEIEARAADGETAGTGDLIARAHAEFPAVVAALAVERAGA